MASPELPDLDLGPGYRDRRGTPIELDQWAELKKSIRYTVVQQATVHGRWFVSTLWNGLLYMPPGLGLVLPFESTIFDRETELPFLTRQHYDEQAAKIGHDELCRMLATRVRAGTVAELWN